MNNRTALLCGFPKTGNTWARLVLANYFNILNFRATESFGKKAAVEIFKHNIKKEIQEKTPLNFKEGFPKVYHTHNSKFKNKEKTKFFNQFDKFIYLYRNPYDLMISFFYHTTVSKKKSLFKFIEKQGLKNLTQFNTFVRTKLPLYMKHVKENKYLADLVLDYDELRKNPNRFKLLIKLFVKEVDDEIFTKAIEMSSFENTRKNLIIAKKKKIENGSLIFLKTRDGRSGQYKEVMNEKLISYITDKWEKAGLTKKLPIFKNERIIDDGRKNSILLCGFEKVGNTWIRFLIYNYFYVLNFGSEKTLTYEELRSIDRNNPSYFKQRLDIELESPFVFKDGFPEAGYTHSAYDGRGLIGKIKHITKFWSFFDKVVYIYRNPFDVIISNFYYWTNRKKPLFTPYIENGFIGFVDLILKRYIYHIKKTIDKVDIVLSYDKLRKDSNEFKKVLRLLVDKIDEEAFKKTVELSSFENIRKMGIETNQKYGMGRKYRGHFARDGRSGQYKEIFKPELIEYIKNQWKREGLEL